MSYSSGAGQIRIGDEAHTRAPLSSACIEPDVVLASGSVSRPPARGHGSADQPRTVIDSVRFFDGAPALSITRTVTR